VKTVPNDVDPKNTKGTAKRVTNIKSVFPERSERTDSSMFVFLFREA
jgi:hypothetical protein